VTTASVWGMILISQTGKGEHEMTDQYVVAKENYDWFQENLAELEKLYGDKYIVIKDKRVINAYDTQKAAFDDMKGKEKPGTFIIQLCSSDESKVLNIFHSLVSFC
jgi:hypothetical protein